MGLRLSVQLIDRATYGASLRGISRIHENDRNSCQSSLGLDKRIKLVKRSSLNFSSLRLSEPGPVADACQIFQGKRPTGVFSLLH